MARRRWLLLLPAALLLTSCRADITLEFDLEEDGSGSYQTEVGVDDALLESLSRFADPSTLLSSLDFGIAGSEVEERKEGEMNITTIRGTFADVAEFTRLVQAETEEGLFDDFQLSVDEEGAVVDARITLPETLTQFADQAALLGGDDADFSASIVIEMPGRITEENATRRAGENRLVWDLELTDTEIDIEAASTFKEAGFPWWIAGIALLAAAILGGWWWWSRRQRANVRARLAQAEASRNDAMT